MIWQVRKSSLVVLALAAIFFANLQSDAQAQNARIEFTVFKIGLIVGVGGGDGVLIFKGKRYPISISGVSLGASIGISSADMVGQVSNIKRVSDIAGVKVIFSAR